ARARARPRDVLHARAGVPRRRSGRADAEALDLHPHPRQHRRGRPAPRGGRRRHACSSLREPVIALADQLGREQTRARYPDQTGYVERDGVRVFYEVYGGGEPTVLLLPTWSIVHSRVWKAQIPY